MKHKKAKAMTLVEVMIALVIIAIIAIGSLGYQYYTDLHTRSALAQMTAMRTAQLLIDDWKSAGGSAAYNPVNLNLGFQASDLENADYQITLDDLPMHLKLSYNDIEQDDQSEITLRKITVQVNWRNDHKVPDGQQGDISMELSTYVRVDGSAE